MASTYSGQFRLLGQRRYGPFFLTQFLGAFNDNLNKNALVVLIAFQGVAWASDGIALGSDVLVNLAAALFILPFFLFSATAGQIADKMEKSQLMRWTKLLEVAIMLCAAVAFYLHSLPVLLVLLFLMGAQSTLFGPVKYGYLPSHLDERELTGGNGLVELGTFLAILLGTIAGGELAHRAGDAGWLIGAALVAVAVLGWLASLGIPRTPASDPALRINWNPFTETVRIIGYARASRTIFLSILGISWFWAVGALYLAQLPNYVRVVLGGNEQVVTLLLATFSFGIGLGSVLCERLSGNRVELGLVPFGAAGLVLFGLLFAFAGVPAHAGLVDVSGFVVLDGSWRVLIDLTLLGVFGGFYIVPLYTLIQDRAPRQRLARIVAANGVINSAFMIGAALFAIAVLAVGLSINQLFLLTALMTAAVFVYIFTVIPEFTMRFMVWMVVHMMYRLRKTGLDNIPDKGGALLVCNHVSFMDGLLIAGAVRRPVRFVMYHRIFDIPLLSFIFRTGKAIPIASAKEDPARLQQAYDRIAAELEAGHVVCIFPEGEITRDGEMKAFRRGVERIIARTPVPVVPMALSGMWGSWFSRIRGHAMRGMPRRLWSRIRLAAGSPWSPERVTAAALFTAVSDLRGEQA